MSVAGQIIIQHNQIQRDTMSVGHADIHCSLVVMLRHGAQKICLICTQLKHAKVQFPRQWHFVPRHCLRDSQTAGANRTERSAARQVGHIVEWTKVLRCESLQDLVN